MRTLQDIVSFEDPTLPLLAKRQVREISLQVVNAVLSEFTSLYSAIC